MIRQTASVNDQAPMVEEIRRHLSPRGPIEEPQNIWKGTPDRTSKIFGALDVAQKLAYLIARKSAEDLFRPWLQVEIDRVAAAT